MDGGGLGPGLIAAIVGLGLVLLFALACGIIRMCKKEDSDRGPGYSVAISNRLFKEVSMDGKELLPCLNCRLIEMGEMACYQERCPQCGQVPPGKKQLYDSCTASLASNSGQRHQVITTRSQMNSKGKATQDSVV